MRERPQRQQRPERGASDDARGGGLVVVEAAGAGGSGVAAIMVAGSNLNIIKIVSLSMSFLMFVHYLFKDYKLMFLNDYT